MVLNFTFLESKFLCTLKMLGDLTKLLIVGFILIDIFHIIN